MKTELRFAVRGRARYLSHLETVDMLLAALRRAGYAVALNEGMKPKPVVSLALPRAVGVETESDLCTVALVGDGHDMDALVERLNATLPVGVVALAARPSTGTPRVCAARYVIETEPGGEALAGAADALLQAAEATVERRSPKGTKVVDVRRWMRDIRPLPDGFEVVIEVAQDGSARPEEVVAAVSRFADQPVAVRRIVRTAIEVAPAILAGANQVNP